MDSGNGSKAVFTDAVGKPMSKPPAGAHLASPINLLNPDRYEFYTFDDTGDLVKRLMTLEEIQQIIANGDSDGMSYNPDAVVQSTPEKKVDDVVNNVQNVLKEEIVKNSDRPVMEDISPSWMGVLPAVFGNSGGEVVPDGSLVVATPETIMVEPTTAHKQVVTTDGKTETTESGAASSSSSTITTSRISTLIPSTTNQPTSTIEDDGKQTTTEISLKNEDSTMKTFGQTETTIQDLETKLPPSTETTIKENDVATTTTINGKVETTKVPMAAEEFPSSTYSFLTTFFGMNTVENSTATTTISNEIASSTQQQQQSTEVPSTIDALDIEKLAVTELLDQLLLSSTKIYESNDVDNNLEAREPTESTSTTEVTTKFEPSVISSIEQLLSQAITTEVEENVENSTQQAQKIHEIMMNMGEKNMTDVQEQTATVMSSLMGNLDVDLIKEQKEGGVATEEPPILDESVDSFISQVVLEEVFNATTIVDDLPSVAPTTTTVTMEALLPKTDEDIELNVSTTENPKSTTIEVSTIELSTITTENLETTTDFTTVPSNVKWAPVSTIAPSTTEKPSPPPPAPPVDLSSQISAGFGLEDTTTQLDSDIYKFVQLCNELAFSFWKSTTETLNPSRSLVVSPFAATSLLAMVFLGARGATSGEMNEILRLDDMVTFNPHLIFRNVTESIEVSKRSGVAASAIVRELYSDKNKAKLLSFYKERARQFYDGHVEEANFKEIGDVIRRRTNLLVKRYTWSKISEFIKENSVKVRPPLAGVSVNIFHTDCSAASTINRDGEIYFQVAPTIRQRRLVPIPAAVWRAGFLAGYEPSLDATAVAIGATDQLITTIFVMPGQQGISAPGDGLARLEQHLMEEEAWIQLLKSLIPRVGLEVQIPRFSHKSFINATTALQKMGLKELFDAKKADLRGLNGVSHELYLSDIVQINNFATCGETRIDETHHIETYPSLSNTRSAKKFRATEESERSLDQGAGFHDSKDYQRAFDDATLFTPEYLSMPLPLRPRQARVPDVPKLRFDRPFLYFVRHNPTGLIMHMGRFNPRLLP